MNTAQLIIEISVLVGAITTITIGLKKGISKDICRLAEQIAHKDKCECKRYLTDFLTDIENKVEKSDIQIQMATETYDHYFRELKGNSWIEDKWNKLMK